MRQRIVKQIDLEAIDSVLYDIEQLIRTQDNHPEVPIPAPDWLRKDIEYIHGLVIYMQTKSPRA